MGTLLPFAHISDNNSWEEIRGQKFLKSCCLYSDWSPRVAIAFNGKNRGYNPPGPAVINRVFRENCHGKRDMWVANGFCEITYCMLFDKLLWPNLMQPRLLLPMNGQEVWHKIGNLQHKWQKLIVFLESLTLLGNRKYNWPVNHNNCFQSSFPCRTITPAGRDIISRPLGYAAGAI